MRKYFPTLIFLFFLSAGFSQAPKSEDYCSIFFGGGFCGKTQGDSIHLVVNNTVVHENQGLYSLSYGSSPGRILVIRHKKELIACKTDEYPEKISYIGKIKRKNHLRVDAVFRGKNYEFNIDLTKGKYLIFSVPFEGGLEMSQYMKAPRFD